MATKTTKSWGLPYHYPWLYEIPAEFDGKIKNTRDPAPGSALLSAVARAVAGLTMAQKLVETFHMMDLNQLYTVLFVCGS